MRYRLRLTRSEAQVLAPPPGPPTRKSKAVRPELRLGSPLLTRLSQPFGLRLVGLVISSFARASPTWLLPPAALRGFPYK